MNRKAKIILMIGVLFLLSIIFIGKSITANIIFNTNSPASSLFLKAIIIVLMSLFLILGLDLSMEVSREEKYNNLEEMLSKGELDVSKIIAVRAIFKGYTNLKGNKMYAGPFRPTIHFSLNSLADINPVYGNWNGADTVVLIPFKDLLEQNKQNFYGGSTVDVALVGYANLPQETIFVKRETNEKDDDFKKRVNQEIKKMGYKVLPGGNWSWGGNWEATNQFTKLMREKGYFSGAHSGSVFSKAEELLEGIVFDKPIQGKPIEKMYMTTIAQESKIPLEYLGVKVDKKTGKVHFPTLNRFYRLLDKHKIQNYINYTEWLQKQTETGDFVIEGKKRNSKLLRDLYSDYLKEVINEEVKFGESELNSKKREFNIAKRNVADWRKRVKKGYKYDGEGADSQKELNSEGNIINNVFLRERQNYQELKEQTKSYKSRNELSDYAESINVWNKFWSKKVA
jgi:hypothetical protein